MKRSELYERIWAIPASKIAEELGISGSRVAAICKRHSIPTPPRGYWAKWAVGKHLPRAPLPQPEADYDVKIGAAAQAPKASAWVAPGVLLRAEAIEERPPVTQAERLPGPPAPAVQATPTPQRPAPEADAKGVDLELVRAVAAELQGMQAIRDLLQAVATRAVHAQPDQAQRILSWAATVRAQLDERDPIAPLLRLAAKAP